MVPLVSSKELNVTEKGFANDLGTANYIPLRLNQAGVMPIIFTAALLVLPVYILNSGLLPIISIEFLKIKTNLKNYLPLKSVMVFEAPEITKL